MSETADLIAKAVDAGILDERAAKKARKQIEGIEKIEDLRKKAKSSSTAASLLAKLEPLLEAKGDLRSASDQIRRSQSQPSDSEGSSVNSDASKTLFSTVKYGGETPGSSDEEGAEANTNSDAPRGRARKGRSKKLITGAENSLDKEGETGETPASSDEEKEGSGDADSSKGGSRKGRSRLTFSGEQPNDAETSSGALSPKTDAHGMLRRGPASRNIRGEPSPRLAGAAPRVEPSSRRLSLEGSEPSASPPTEVRPRSPSVDTPVPVSAAPGGSVASLTALAGLVDSKRGRFIGKVIGGSNQHLSALMSIDKVEFLPGHIQIEVKIMSPVTAKKSRVLFEMLVTCGHLQWNHIRTDAQILALHEKLVMKSLKTSGEIPCPLKSSKADRVYKAIKNKEINIIAKGKQKDENDHPDAYSLLAELEDYLNIIANFGVLVSQEKFRDFMDPTDEPTSWLMAKISKKRGNLTVNKTPDCYCAIYGGEIYVFKDMEAETSMFVIDLLCAKIDHVLGMGPGGAFFVQVDGDEKQQFIFESRVEAFVEDWVITCRRARRDDAASSKDLLSYAKSLDLQFRPPPTQAGDSELLLTRSNSTFVTVNVDAPLYEPDDVDNVKLNEKGEFLGGTVDKILDRVLQGVFDQNPFLRCFPMFLQPEDLIKKLQARFVHPNPKVAKYREEVVDFALAWYRIFPEDFAPMAMQKALKAFVQLSHTTTGIPEGLTAKIERLVKSSKASLNSSRTSSQGEIEMYASILPVVFKAGAFDVFDISPLEIARQSTLVAAELWKSMNMRELLYWNSKENTTKSANMMAMVNHFNYLSSFISTWIMSGCSAKQRGFYLRHAVEILKAAVDLRNYHLVFAIIAAFNSSHLSRLKKSWVFLAASHLKVLDDVKATFNVEGNYAKYRDILAHAPPPCLPQIAVLAKDVVFVDDGNKTRLEGTQLINWNKCLLMSNSIGQVANSSQVRFPFKAVPEIQQFLAEYKVMSDNDLWMLSLTLEPRENKS